MNNISGSPEFDTPVLGLIERLLTLLGSEEQTAELFEALGIRIVPVVLDANVIIKDVIRYARKKEPTGILLAARIGFVRFFCTTEVRAEVLEHLPEVASRHTVSDEAMRAWQKHYAPLITALDPSGIQALSAKAVLVLYNDPDDLPTAQIIDEIRPHAVLSEDRHLSPYSPAGKDWTRWAAAYRDHSIAQATFVSMRFGGSISISIAMSSIEALIVRILKVDWRILLGVGLAVGVGTGFAVTRPTSRKWLKERLDAIGAWASEHLAEGVSDIYDELVAMDQKSKEANQFLEKSALVHEPPQLAREYVIEVIARTHAYLTAREISERMRDLGYEPRGEHPERYVAKLLRENPRLFERHPSRQWGFASGYSEAG